MHTIHVSDTVYRRLQEQAAQRQMTTEQVIEQLLAHAPGADELDAEVPAAGSAEALAAVERLTRLFARLPLPDVDAVLNDPALTLAHADFDHLPQ